MHENLVNGTDSELVILLSENSLVVRGVSYSPTGTVSWTTRRNTVGYNRRKIATGHEPAVIAGKIVAWIHRWCATESKEAGRIGMKVHGTWAAAVATALVAAATPTALRAVWRIRELEIVGESALMQLMSRLTCFSLDVLRISLLEEMELLDELFAVEANWLVLARCPRLVRVEGVNCGIRGVAVEKCPNLTAVAVAGPLGDVPRAARVEVRSFLGAALFVDGRLAGTVSFREPFTVYVETGSHAVTVQYDDGRQEEHTVQAVFGQTAYVEARSGVFVAGGSFVMGSPDGKGSFSPRPQHQVTLSDFQIMPTTVTYDMYDRYGEDTGRGKRPVLGVSWYDAIRYANWLSARHDLEHAYSIVHSQDELGHEDSLVEWNRHADGWRLPTEAEWEYAARGGQLSQGYAYSGSDNPDEVAWHEGNSQQQPQPVAGKAPNELGLYDMSGNVEEWCWDGYQHYVKSAQHNPAGNPSSVYRLLRGGCWRSRTSYSRVTVREHIRPFYYCDIFGFRLVRNV